MRSKARTAWSRRPERPFNHDIKGKQSRGGRWGNRLAVSLGGGPKGKEFARMIIKKVNLKNLEDVKGFVEEEQPVRLKGFAV